MSAEPVVFLSAGEASGDRYAGSLAREIRRRVPDARLLGMGGRRMQAAGVERIAGLDRLAVMGIAELAGSLAYFLRLRRRARARLVREDVDLLVAVDYPGFNLPLASFASGRGVPVLYYAPPQVWAWRRGRAGRLADAADLVCAVLPFEEEILSEAGARVEFVGHPLLDETEPAAGAGGGQGDAAGRHREAADAGRADSVPAPRLGLFPGSREQEVHRMLAPMIGAARRLARRRPSLEVAVARAPGVPEAAYADAGDLPTCSAPEAARRSTAALAASGTVTLELALHDTPMAVAYRMHPVTYGLARRLVQVEDVALVNLLHGSRLVPELLQGEATGENMARAVAPLLDPGPDRKRVRRGLARVRSRLGRPGVAGRVADGAVRLIEAARPPG